MECPVFNNEQPGCTYYESPLSIYNLGVVNHVHQYEEGNDRNNSRHIVTPISATKVLQRRDQTMLYHWSWTHWLLQFLEVEHIGGELVIIFGNWSKRKKNNTALKLLAFLVEMGYFKKVQRDILVCRSSCIGKPTYSPPIYCLKHFLHQIKLQFIHRW